MYKIPPPLIMNYNALGFVELSNPFPSQCIALSYYFGYILTPSCLPHLQVVTPIWFIVTLLQHVPFIAFNFLPQP
jgi:hypothetical protein